MVVVNSLINSRKHTCTYIRTPPDGHLGNTVTSLLRQIFFGRLAKRPYIFLKKKQTSFVRSPVNTAKYFWPIDDRINGVPHSVLNVVRLPVMDCFSVIFDNNIFMERTWIGPTVHLM